MSIAKAGFTISSMLDSGSEDEMQRSDVEAMLTPQSADNGKAAKRRAMPCARTVGTARVSRAKAPARRTSGAAGAKAAPAKRTSNAKGRTPLAERELNERVSDTEEVDNFEDEKEQRMKKRGREPAAEQPAKSAPAKKGERAAIITRPKRKKAAMKQEDADVEDVSDIALQTKFAAKTTSTTRKPRVAKRAPSPKTIPETQADPMDIEPSILETQDDVTNDHGPSRPTQRGRAALRSTSRQPAPYARTRRAESQSDAERAYGGDSALRRKLGDVSTKLESLESKYRTRQDLGHEAASNFEELKRATNEKTRAAEALIASLKEQLRTQTELAKETKALRMDAERIGREKKDLAAENKGLKDEKAAQQMEIKNLNAKLSASRNTSVEPAKNVPSSAAKPARTVVVGSAEAQAEAVKRQLKEDLYSDLTGLILRNVKRGDGENLFDCLQTGRNGSKRTFPNLLGRCLH